MSQHPSAVVPGSLREHIERLRASGNVMTLGQAVAVAVPLAVELAQRHAAGERFYVHGSSIVLDAAGDYALSPDHARIPPEHPNDRACLAPEERSSGQPGDAHASVFALGALLYEMCTGATVGPGMRRPTDMVPSLPSSFESVLAKALVSDPTHRPDDLKALAQAIHHLAPAASLPPPPADESHLEHDAGFEVDVSMSMLPPAPAAPAETSPYGVAVQQAAPPPSGIDQATGELASLKARLESDPRPRYVVIREGMDHGPFSAVELLQQIANHTFEENDVLRDTFANEERAIADWEEFAPFADHAKRHRDIAAEKVALEHSVEQEKKSTRGKAFIGIAAVGGFLLIAGAWFLTQAGTRSDEVAVQSETVTSIETDGGLKVPVKKRRRRGGVVGSQNGIPVLAGGMSCEAAQARYVEEIKMGQKGQADITRAQYGAVLNSGSYLNGCGVPSSMGVNVCVAVQNGRAVGVTVRTEPHNAGVAACISRRVRGLSFPSHPKLDVTRTRFAPQ